MELAKDWVLNSNEDITEIAYRIHYSNVNSFNRAYRNYFGILPSDHREDPDFEIINTIYKEKLAPRLPKQPFEQGCDFEPYF